MPNSSCLQSIRRVALHGFEGLRFRRTVTPPDAHSVVPPDRLPKRLDYGRAAGSATCPTPDFCERDVPEVVQFLNFTGVVREDIEEVAPPATHSLVAVVAALHGDEARLDLDLIVH